MVKIINLTNSDELILVDDEDYEYLMQWNWQLSGNCGGVYRCENIDGIKYTIIMSRIIAKRMGLNLSNEIDHIDRDIFNNKRNNLRAATNSQQNMNKGLQKNNTSNYRGVNWHNASQKYRVRISLNGKQINLGLFDCPIEAANMYDYYAKQLFGEFAYLNFPENK